jgi:SAM-dependent methyltransferase
VPADRDVGAFNDRAPGYESGWRGQLHHEIAERTVHAALACVPAPRRVLDAGCGTGYALRALAARRRRAQARTRARATALRTAAGLREPRWHPAHALIIATVTATRPR